MTNETKERLKRILRLALIPALLVLIGFGAYYGYVSTRQARLLSQARRYMEKSNTSTALLCLRRALHYNPRHVETCRLMAEFSEQIGSPAALLWRSRVVELSPKSVPDRISLAQTAMGYRDYITATNALEGITTVGKKTAAYHNIAGAVSLACNRTTQAENHFIEASRLEPTNPVPRMNLAIVRLQGTNAVALEQSRATLRGLCTNSTLRCQALRELVLDAIRYQQTNTALLLSSQLLQETNAGFSDRLLRLDVFKVMQNADLESALVNVEQEAVKDPRKIYELSMWQATRCGLKEALDWLQALPDETQTNQPAALLSAQFQAMLADWPALESRLGPQDWAELDFVRHAFISRALRGQGLTSSALIEWTKALKAANDRKEDLTMLLRVAAQWNWLGDAEDLLWRLVSRYPSEKWARDGLARMLLSDGRTRSLMALYGQEAQASPGDLSAKNNLAMLALLLDARELRPHELAREVYLKAPSNPAYASTYAFSLHVQEKSDDALKVFQRLKPQELEQPSIAVYYGMVLQATGNSNQAKKYLDLASKAPLLPEERRLVNRARAGA